MVTQRRCRANRSRQIDAVPVPSLVVAKADDANAQASTPRDSLASLDCRVSGVSFLPVVHEQSLILDDERSCAIEFPLEALWDGLAVEWLAGLQRQANLIPGITFVPEVDVGRVVIVRMKLDAPTLTRPAGCNEGDNEAVLVIGSSSIHGLADRHTKDRLESKQNMFGSDESSRLSVVPRRSVARHDWKVA